MSHPEKLDEPYCSNCGYSLVGLTDSAKCVECGRPLVEVLMRRSIVHPQRSRRYRSAARLGKWPVLDVAIGPGADGRRGVARGLIAIGDVAIGGLALGGIAMGGVTLGGLSLGVFAIGGLALGLLALGGWAIGGIAAGGGAVGLLAMGGGALGYVALGGGVIAVYGSGGGGLVRYGRLAGRNDPEAVELFQKLSWLVSNNWMTLGRWLIGVALILLIAIGLTAMWAIWRHDRTQSA